MEKIVSLFEHYGYVVVFLGVFLDTVGLPFPGEIALFIAGALSFRGRLNLLVVIFLGTVAAILGDSLMFLIGRMVTEAREQRTVELYCRWTACTLGSSYCYQRARRSVERFRARVLLLAKFILGARQFIPPIAGMARMRPLQFIGWDALGVLLWVAVVSSLGYWSRSHLESVLAGFERLKSIFSIAMASGVMGYFFWKIYRLQRFGPPKADQRVIEAGRQHPSDLKESAR
ncbi:Inner membrane protein YghB [bacterium HR08]|nr:Inner membrane protein YghB [bacterium HR08]